MKKNEWKRTHLKNQRKRLILKATKALDELLNIPEIKKLTTYIPLSKEEIYFIPAGIFYVPKIKGLYLTNEGLVEKYCEIKERKYLISFFNFNNYTPKERQVKKDLFPQIVEKYKINPSTIYKLKKDLEF